MGRKTTQRSEPQEHGMGITGTQILGLRFRVQSLGFRVLDPNSLKHKKGGAILLLENDQMSSTQELPYLEARGPAVLNGEARV